MEFTKYTKKKKPLQIPASSDSTQCWCVPMVFLQTANHSVTDLNSGLLEDHLEGAVVEGVSSHHPHDLLLHHSFVGGPSEGRSKGFDARQDPEGVSGRDGEGAVGTWEQGWNMAVKGTARRSSPLAGANRNTKSKDFRAAQTILRRHWLNVLLLTQRSQAAGSPLHQAWLLFLVQYKSYCLQHSESETHLLV